MVHKYVNFQKFMNLKKLQVSEETNDLLACKARFVNKFVSVWEQEKQIKLTRSDENLFTQKKSRGKLVTFVSNI